VHKQTLLEGLQKSAAAVTRVMVTRERVAARQRAATLEVLRVLLLLAVGSRRAR
jgi:hypothetical protein